MEKKLNCPACSTPMSKENFGAIRVDVCNTGCSRIWFEEGELQRVDHRSKGAGPALEAALTEPFADNEGGEPFNCPRCTETMDRVIYELESSITLDECPTCAGVLLDPGELKAIRNRKLTAGEFRKARRRWRKNTARKAARHKANQMNTAAMLILISNG